MAYRFSDAGLVLAQAGISQVAVAQLADVSTPSISQQLTGRRRLQPAVAKAIRYLAGDEAADQIIELCDSTLVDQAVA